MELGWGRMEWGGTGQDRNGVEMGQDEAEMEWDRTGMGQEWKRMEWDGAVWGRNGAGWDGVRWSRMGQEWRRMG